MPALRIPREQQQGLIKLLSLSDSQAVEFLAGLNSATSKPLSDMGISRPDLPTISGIPSEDVERMLETINDLYRVRTRAEVSTDEFVNDLIESIEAEEFKDFSLRSETVPTVKERLKGFLDIQALSLWAKAVDLRYEYERTIHDFRILTDARPVFGHNISERPNAAVVTHTLKVAYHGTRGAQEIYFSLDEDDLDYLKHVIERAETKAKSLKEALASGHINVINPS